MFYDVLMEKRAAKKKKRVYHIKKQQPTEDDVRQARLGGALTLAGVTGSGLGAHGLYRATRGKTKGTVESVLSHMKKIDPNKAVVLTDTDSIKHFSDPDLLPDSEWKNYFASTNTKDDGIQLGRFEDFGEGGEKARKLLDDGYFHIRNPDDASDIIIAPLKDSKRSTSALMHELGHATGNKFSKSNLNHRLYGLGQKLTQGPGMLISPALAAGNILATRTAQSEEELKKRSKINNIAAGLYGAATLPMLAEEARANIRAVGLGKKLDVPVSKRELMGAMGTYLASAGSQTLLPWYLTRRAIKKRRKELRERK